MKSKEALILSRLNQHNICIQQIEEIIQKYCIKSYIGIIYTSHLDNLGNNSSDLDIYVLSNTINHNGLIYKNGYYLFTTKINNLSLDIEFWFEQSINKILDNQNELSDLSKLKLLRRLQVGYLFHKSMYWDTLNITLKKINIDKKFVHYYLLLSGSEFDDAIKMYRSKNFLCSISCLHRSLDYIMAAYCTSQGKTVMNLKWLPKIVEDFFLKEKDDYAIFYMNFQFKTCEQEIIENKIETCSDIISSIHSYITLNF